MSPEEGLELGNSCSNNHGATSSPQYDCIKVVDAAGYDDMRMVQGVMGHMHHESLVGCSRASFVQLQPHMESKKTFADQSKC
jgi:hypothetical protein